MDNSKTPEIKFIFEAKVLTGNVQDAGITTYGKRRIIPINGGSFEGEDYKGIILSGGADWQTIRADGTADIEARYTLQTDDGILIYVQDKGIRHTGADGVYMRTSTVFEVQESKYSWLTKSIIIGSGMRMEDQLIIRFYRVL